VLKNIVNNKLFMWKTSKHFSMGIRDNSHKIPFS
jgi:hypothetical protein